jgi:hypothetical protein
MTSSGRRWRQSVTVCTSCSNRYSRGYPRIRMSFAWESEREQNLLTSHKRILVGGFTAVEPSGPMLDVCRPPAEAEGIASRCDFHEGYLDSLPAGERYDAATCFLVSQFILDEQERSGFFTRSRPVSGPEEFLQVPTSHRKSAHVSTKPSCKRG